VAERAFGARRGALVAIEPATGGVLAFVSMPGYDPNLFVDGIDPQSWDALMSSPDRPLNNRALAGLYPPGSTFKPFMALAALELGKRTPASVIQDPGYFIFGDRRFRDSKPGGHGTVDLYKSIVLSSDTYYYILANDLGIDAISHAAHVLERLDALGQRWSATPHPLNGATVYHASTISGGSDYATYPSRCTIGAHDPSPGLQTPMVQFALNSLQSTGRPSHLPLWVLQVSFTVHRSPSSHA